MQIKIQISIKILILIFAYVLKRRFQDFKALAQKRVHLGKIYNLNSNVLVRYSIFWLNLLKINSCFTRSLVIRDLLYMANKKPFIEIGVSSENSKFQSHCWVRLGNFYTENPEIRKNFKIIETT